jgi:hypothetical protein
MLVNEVIVEKAVAGDICTFKLPFRIRLSDRLYKSKALFYHKIFKSLFQHLETGFLNLIFWYLLLFAHSLKMLYLHINLLRT